MALHPHPGAVGSQMLREQQVHEELRGPHGSPQEASSRHLEKGPWCSGEWPGLEEAAAARTEEEASLP